MRIVFLIVLLVFSAFNSFSQNLYDIPNITLIELEFEESNWNDLMNTYKADGLGELLVGTCTVNGVEFDSVGVRYKGNSTYNAMNGKNPLHIELDYILTQNYQGYKTLKLSNGKNDPSFVREVLSYEIGRKYMDMPLSNYARVMINGEFYGMFSSSESINGDFMERRLYCDGNNFRFKCNPQSVGGGGGGGGSSLEYLGSDSSAYLTYYELKSDIGWNQLVDFTYQLENDLASVEDFLDVDRSLWMLAFNNVLANLDSYTGPFKQNYYLMKDETGRVLPIIWDLNECIGGFEMVDGGGGGPPVLTDVTELDPYKREGDPSYPLISQLFSVDRYRKMYIAHCRTMVEENLTGGDYYTRAEDMQALIDTDVQDDPNAFYSYSQFTTNLDNSTGSGPGGAYGVAEVLDAREAYLSAHTDFNLIQPTISGISTTTAYPNSTVTVTATITDVNYAYLGHREYKGDAFTKTEMFDDGAHDDGAASDGVYGITIPTNASDIQYYIYAENTDAGIFAPRRAEHEFYNIILTADVVINEIMPKNTITASDQDGEYDDWVELYNNSSSSVDISGYYLSDDETNLTKWTIPSGTSIGANDYLIIWLDNDTMQAGLHTNFKLTSGGETLFFSDASGNPVNAVPYPVMEASSTYGRYPNGTGEFIRMIPTYDAENSYSTIGIEEKEATATVLLYPNPTRDNLTIVTDFKSNVQYEIYDLQGQKLFSDEMKGSANISVSDWREGIYLLVFPDQGIVRKFMKQ